MAEDGWIKEPRVDTPYIYVRIGQGKVQVQVTTESDTIEKAVELSCRTLYQWLLVRYGHDDVAEITKVWSIGGPEELSVSEYQKTTAVGVPSQRKTDRGTSRFIQLVRKPKPAEDLSPVAEVVTEELTGRDGPDDGNPTVA